MENRDRDEMSRKSKSTPEQKNSDSSAEFGQKIDRSENLSDEPNRKSDNGRVSGSSSYGSSSGRSNQSSLDDVDRDDLNEESIGSRH